MATETRIRLDYSVCGSPPPFSLKKSVYAAFVKCRLFGTNFNCFKSQARHRQWKSGNHVWYQQKGEQIQSHVYVRHSGCNSVYSKSEVISAKAELRIPFQAKQQYSSASFCDNLIRRLEWIPLGIIRTIQSHWVPIMQQKSTSAA